MPRAREILPHSALRTRAIDSSALAYNYLVYLGILRRVKYVRCAKVNYDRINLITVKEVILSFGKGLALLYWIVLCG